VSFASKKYFQLSSVACISPTKYRKKAGSLSAACKLQHRCSSEGPLPPGGQQHGDAMTSWRTPLNVNNRNVLEHECGTGTNFAIPPPLPITRTDVMYVINIIIIIIIMFVYSSVDKSTHTRSSLKKLL